MLTVKDIMSTNIVSVKPDTEIIEAAKVLLENRFNGLPVVDDNGKVVGIICQSDLIAQQKSLPIPTLFTFLDGFIPLTSLKKMESEIKKYGSYIKLFENVHVLEANKTMYALSKNFIKNAQDFIYQNNKKELPHLIKESKTFGNHPSFGQILNVLESIKHEDSEGLHIKNMNPSKFDVQNVISPINPRSTPSGFINTKVLSMNYSSFPKDI